ncbi:hypothetical protein [Nocardia alni]|uniref:hypothetical protein n=1 Tax=Nocardia alni TaxID=2815723 RepID=UPI001C231AD9|nr:hypothetical protein [Nocardia alni]
MEIGVAHLFEQFARISADDYVALVYTPNSRVYAAHCGVFLTAHEISWISVPMIPLADSELTDRLDQKLPDPANFRGNLIVVTLERDTMSHFEVFTPLFQRYGAARTRILRIISATDSFFKNALTLGPDELESLNATLLAEFSGESNIRVTSAAGTDLQIQLDQEKYDWISNRGKLRPGAFTILPPGEIATYPAQVDGTLVADGAVNCNFITDLDMRLADTPITFELQNSEIKSFHCQNAAMHDLLCGAFEFSHSMHVGELGFGTNRGIPEFIALNSHMNERRPGLHIGFGQHNQPLSVVKYEARIHIDVITDDATVHFADGRSVTLTELVPIAGVPHPRLIRDEDITGDCCSAGCSIVTVGIRS